MNVIYLNNVFWSILQWCLGCMMGNLSLQSGTWSHVPLGHFKVPQGNSAESREKIILLLSVCRFWDLSQWPMLLHAYLRQYACRSSFTVGYFITKSGLQLQQSFKLLEYVDLEDVLPFWEHCNSRETGLTLNMHTHINCIQTFSNLFLQLAFSILNKRQCVCFQFSFNQMLFICILDSFFLFLCISFLLSVIITWITLINITY